MSEKTLSFDVAHPISCVHIIWKFKAEINIHDLTPSPLWKICAVSAFLFFDHGICCIINDDGDDQVTYTKYFYKVKAADDD